MPATTEVRRCTVCGRQLPEGSRKDAKFCGGTCRQAAFKRRHPAPPKPTQQQQLIAEFSALKPYERRALVLQLAEQLAEPDAGNPAATMVHAADQVRWQKDGSSYTSKLATITKVGRGYRLEQTGDVFPVLWLAKRAGGLWLQGWSGSVPAQEPHTFDPFYGF